MRPPWGLLIGLDPRDYACHVKYQIKLTEDMILRVVGVCSRLRGHGHAHVQLADPTASSHVQRGKEDANQRDPPGPRIGGTGNDDEPGTFELFVFPSEQKCHLISASGFGVANIVFHHFADEWMNWVRMQFIELCILLGCDYLEPIKGVGPKSALKLMKDHGSLGKVLEHLRAKSEEKAKAQGKKKVIEEENVESEDEAVAPSSVIDGGSDAEEEDEEAAEERRIRAEKAAKKKAAAAKKGTGGVHVPENWLWEEAKKLFETPDVTPASEIEVRATPF